MRAEDAVAVVEALERAGVGVWVDGGWGVDALAADETRPHSDLDLAVDRRDLERIERALAGRRVRCLSPELQARFRLGYEWGDRDEHDLGLLARLFGTPLPPTAPPRSTSARR